MRFLGPFFLVAGHKSQFANRGSQESWANAGEYQRGGELKWAGLQ